MTLFNSSHFFGTTTSVFILLFAALALHVGVADSAAAPAQGDRPNVVLVITDDQGYGDLSCHGNPLLKTPNLDSLYGQSIRFTDFHVSPTCSPTRGALMSGHYTNRCGPWHTIMGRSLLFEGEATLGEVFKKSGYATGMFGKWHLGDNYPYRAEDRGFMQVVRHGGGGIGQTPDFWNNAYFDDSYFRNSQPKLYEGYCTDVFFRQARQFIYQCKEQDHPFFAYIATNTPHGPFHCPEYFWKPYAEHPKVNDTTAVFYGMIANIDDNIGHFRRWLEQEGLAENTIFIFMTDNGTASGAHIFNAGMRGQKGSEYDGGHRVPFFVHWPKGGLDSGRDIPQLAAHIDVLPTLIELCRLEPPRDYDFDGQSLAPLIKNEKVDWPDRTIITDSQRVLHPQKWRKSSTMTQRYRLVNGQELYDIQADPGQKKDVAKDHPAVVAKLRNDYESWWQDIAPAIKKTAHIVVGHLAENPSCLTAHDWLTESGRTPWNQAAIRAGVKARGHWAVRVDRPGRYQITLRRWPLELSKPIAAGVHAGQPVPGLRAWRERPGVALPIQSATLKIAGIEKTQQVDTKSERVIFEVELPAGETQLTGEFQLADGTTIGSYYAIVERK